MPPGPGELSSRVALVSLQTAAQPRPASQRWEVQPGRRQRRTARESEPQKLRGRDKEAGPRRRAANSKSADSSLPRSARTGERPEGSLPRVWLGGRSAARVRTSAHAQRARRPAVGLARGAGSPTPSYLLVDDGASHFPDMGQAELSRRVGQQEHRLAAEPDLEVEGDAAAAARLRGAGRPDDRRGAHRQLPAGRGAGGEGERKRERSRVRILPHGSRREQDGPPGPRLRTGQPGRLSQRPGGWAGERAAALGAAAWAAGGVDWRRPLGGQARSEGGRERKGGKGAAGARAAPRPPSRAAAQPAAPKWRGRRAFPPPGSWSLAGPWLRFLAGGEPPARWLAGRQPCLPSE